jgi:hypothetical protein
MQHGNMNVKSEILRSTLSFEYDTTGQAVRSISSDAASNQRRVPARRKKKHGVEN